MIRSEPSPSALESPSRCPIPDGDELFLNYHDKEWGRPVTDDNRLYEKVCLEAFQSGLSWRTILHKRPAFREAFDDFEIERVARFDERRIVSLLENEAIVRNRRKIEAVIHNASCALRLQQELGSLSTFFWSFEPEAAVRPDAVTLDWLAANPTTPESTRLARELRSRGWKFVGPTTMYALMQALGLVNDHLHTCPAREPVERQRSRFKRPANRRVGRPPVDQRI